MDTKNYLTEWRQISYPILYTRKKHFSEMCLFADAFKQQYMTSGDYI